MFLAANIPTSLCNTSCDGPHSNLEAVSQSPKIGGQRETRGPDLKPTQARKQYSGSSVNHMQGNRDVQSLTISSMYQI